MTRKSRREKKTQRLAATERGHDSDCHKSLIRRQVEKVPLPDPATESRNPVNLEKPTVRSCYNGIGEFHLIKSLINSSANFFCQMFHWRRFYCSESLYFRCNRNYTTKIEDLKSLQSICLPLSSIDTWVHGSSTWFSHAVSYPSTVLAQSC